MEGGLERDLMANMNTAAKAPTCEGGRESFAPAGAPIDLDHLRRYTLGDARLEQEILWLFVEQTPATLGALKGAATNREWVKAAHTLKGSARAVGAWRIAELADQAERLGGITDRAACDQVLRDLEEAAAEARIHIVALGPPA